MRAQRLAPLSGIVFVVLVVMGFIVVGGSTPDQNDSASKIVSYWADHHDKEFAAAAIVVLGTLFLAIFVATLRDRAHVTGKNPIWQNLILIGGAASVAGFLVAVGFHTALADGGDHHYSADAMVALNVLDNDSFWAFAIPLGIMMIGAAGATLSTGFLPRWLGWVALVIGIATFTPVGFIGFALTGIWIIIASILLSQSAEAAPAAAAPTSA